MAQYFQLGDFGGPGEPIAAEILKNGLPEDWIVVANRRLPNSNDNEIDFIVIAENHFFIVENKHWYGRYKANDVHWETKTSHGVLSRNGSPLAQAKNQSYVLLNLLRRRVYGFSGAIPKHQRRSTESFAFLTHPDFSLDDSLLTPTEKKRVLYPNNVVEVLTTYDASNDLNLGFKHIRNDVTKFAIGLEGLDNTLKSIREYEIIERLPDLVSIRVFKVRHAISGRESVLRCYEFDPLKNDILTEFHKREVMVLSKLESTNRTWKLMDSFFDSATGWYVVPCQPVQNTMSLKDTLTTEFPKRQSDGIIQIEDAISFLKKAFTALSEVQNAVPNKVVVHRLLSPERVWISTEKSEIYFTDFVGAKMASLEEFGTGTAVVSMVQHDESSLPWRAPEAKHFLEESEPKSDVYSLGLIMAHWLTDSFDLQNEEFTTRLDSYFELQNLFSNVLNTNVQERWNAQQVLLELESLQTQFVVDDEQEDWEVNQVVDDRYTLKELLGSGGQADAWRATSIFSGEEVVVKRIKDIDHLIMVNDEIFLGLKLQETFGVAPLRDKITSPLCLVYKYVAGKTLHDYFQESEAIDVDAVKAITLKALNILKEVHSKNLVHGDISQKNVIFDDTSDESAVSLIDFGLTTVVGGEVKGSTKLFAAPEVLMKSPVTQSSDLYSLAAVILHGLLGRPPYAGLPRDTFDVLYLSDGEKQRFTDDQLAFMDVLFRAVSEEITNRPADAEEFITQVNQAKALVPPEITNPEARINPFVEYLRGNYQYSRNGAVEMLGLDIDNEYDMRTYVKTQLDEKFLPAILDKSVSLGILTGNPGDGKTAFLVTILEKLRKLPGARVTHEDRGGWVVELDGHIYESILDASESFGGLSSDERLSLLLNNVRSGNHSGLIAMNDGRMRKYFSDHATQFEDLAEDVEDYLSRGSEPMTKGFKIIDLKLRTLANFENQGLAKNVLDAMVAVENWKECVSCISQLQCPIFANRNSLAQGAAEPLTKLVLASHLRRKRRATFRDLRSAFSWSITGDLTCEEVNEASLQGQNLMLNQSRLLPNLVFDSVSSGYLLSEWSEMDPALRANPRLERRLLDSNPNRREDIEFKQRAVYLNVDKNWNEEFSDAEVFGYRYFDEFVSLLEQDNLEIAKKRMLLGLSRITSSPVFVGDGLAIGNTGKDTGWTVLRIVDETNFELRSSSRASEFVEYVPDTLRLIYSHTPGSPSVVLRIPLDMYELIASAAHGFIADDEGSDSILYEIKYFTNRLASATASEAILVGPTGSKSKASLVDGRITLED
jgi:serine/threonine protein kinase